MVNLLTIFVGFRSTTDFHVLHLLIQNTSESQVSIETGRRLPSESVPDLPRPPRRLGGRSKSNMIIWVVSQTPSQSIVTEQKETSHFNLVFCRVILFLPYNYSGKSGQITVILLHHSMDFPEIG